MIRRLVFGFALTLVACGGPEVSQLASSTPLGTVSGVVTNTRFEPIEGATVTLTLGEGGDGSANFKATSNGAGSYFFKSVPAGSTGQVVITRSGFGSVRTTVTVPANAGNFPVDDANGNAGIALLMENNGSMRFSVYSASGKPAKGARGLLEVRPAGFIATVGGTFGSQQGVISVEATASDLGELAFAGVPSAAELARVDGSYTLYIGALDEDGDGVADSEGTARYYPGSDLFMSPPPPIQLERAGDASSLAITSSNLQSLRDSSTSPPLRNAVKGSEPVTIVFNQPIVEAARSVTVLREDCSTAVDVTVTQRTPNILSVTPTSPWSPGAEFHLAVRATGKVSGDTREFIGYLFAVDPAAPRPVATTPTFQVKKAAGNTNGTRFQAGDTMFVRFDTPLMFRGSSVGRAFFDFDLDEDGSIGNPSPGEKGTAFINGFDIQLAEETVAPTNGAFVCRTNGYGSRYVINFPSVLVPTVGLPSSTAVNVVLPVELSSQFGYQTPWGAGVTGSFEAATFQVQQ